VFWNLVYAVGIGLVMASLFFMKKMGDISNQYSKIAPVIKEKKMERRRAIRQCLFRKNIHQTPKWTPLFWIYFRLSKPL